MKLLIIGASGVLGSSLYGSAIEKRWNVLGTYYSRECEGLYCFRLEDRKSIAGLFNFFRPEVVILAGGITNVDLCEARPKLAEKVNINGTLEVAKRAKRFNARLVYLSTDYIFNGEDGPYGESDSPSPINVYGRTKAEAENIARSVLKDSLIVRTSQLYGYDCQKKNFAVKVILSLSNNKDVHAADDFYSTPTYTRTLSEFIIGLIEKRSSGVFNIAGKDFLDRYSYVSKISDVFGLNKSYIKKTKLKDLRLKAKRPAKGGLKIGKIEKTLEKNIMGIDTELRSFKEEFSKIRSDI